METIKKSQEAYILKYQVWYLARAIPTIWKLRANNTWNLYKLLFGSNYARVPIRLNVLIIVNNPARFKL